MLAPGRSRLATRPVSTGSEPSGNTIGIVPDADFAARIAGGVAGMMISTPSPASSAARAGSRSNLPSANLQTSSTFDPSTYPSSLRPCVSSFHQSLIPGSVAGLKMPIRGMRPDALLFILRPCAPPGYRQRDALIQNQARTITLPCGPFHCMGTSGACPLWVISGHLRCKKACPLYPQKRTFGSAKLMSALGQKATGDLRQVLPNLRK